MKCSDCSKDVRPIVAVDIDGTLAMHHEDITRFCSRYYAKAPPTFPYDGGESFADYLELTIDEYRALKLAYRQGGNKRFVKPYPGALDFMTSLHILGAEIWVATTRPYQRLDNIDPDTREWLRRNEIEIDGLLYGDDKYQQLIETVDAERIIAVFEDLDEQMVIGSKLLLPMFQVYRPHNETSRWFGGDLGDAWLFARDRFTDWTIDHE